MIPPKLPSAGFNYVIAEAFRKFIRGTVLCEICVKAGQIPSNLISHRTVPLINQ